MDVSRSVAGLAALALAGLVTVGCGSGGGGTPTGPTPTLVVNGVRGFTGVMVPCRETFEFLGYTQTWNATTDVVTLTKGGRQIWFKIGTRQAGTGGAPPAGTPPEPLSQATRYILTMLNVPLPDLLGVAGLTYTILKDSPDEVRYLVDGKLIIASLWTPRDAQVVQSVLTEDPTPGTLVKLETNRGDIYLELFDDVTPITAGNFLDLVLQGFYDRLTFHRVVENFVIQGGDPVGTGYGGPGFTIPDEANKGLQHLRGSLSMAKTAEPNSAGSQFFICLSTQSSLNGVYSVFGKCVSGLETVDAIAVGDWIRRAVTLRLSSRANAAMQQARAARVPVSTQETEP